MKRIPNGVVSELIRLLPVLIENIPPGRSTRVDNAIRLTKKLIVKLKTLKDEINLFQPKVSGTNTFESEKK